VAGYSVWIEAEQWAGPWDPVDSNSDVTVTFENGDAWMASFVSYQNVLTLVKNAASSGEQLGGRYLAITDMILVDEITRPRIEAVVADLIGEQAFNAHFRRCAEPAYAPVYLGTLDELDTASADEGERLAWVATTLARIGFTLTSGVAPDYHELWAMRVSNPQPAATDPIADPAAEFERRFLAWVHITFGVIPEGRQGTNAEWWEVQIGGSPVAIGFVRAANRDPREWDWMLRIEEAEPLVVLPQVEAHFAEGAGLKRKLPSGRIRMQFKSSALTHPFADQTEGT
jgi:hypothetical protein